MALLYTPVTHHKLYSAPKTRGIEGRDEKMLQYLCVGRVAAESSAAMAHRMSGGPVLSIAAWRSSATCAGSGTTLAGCCSRFRGVDKCRSGGHWKPGRQGICGGGGRGIVVEALPPNASDGKGGGQIPTTDGEKTRRSPRRRRSRKKGGKANSAAVVAQQAAATEVLPPAAGSEVESPASNLETSSSDVTVESLPESAAMRGDNEDVPTIEEYSSSVPLRVDLDGQSEGSVTNEEHGLEVPRKKKKRRSRRAKGAKAGVRGADDANLGLVSDAEPAGRVVTGERSVGEGSVSSHVTSDAEGSIPLQTTLTTGSAGAEKKGENTVSDEVPKKPKRKAKTAPGIRQEARRGKGRRKGSGQRDAALVPDAPVETVGSAGKREEKVGSEGISGQRSSESINETYQSKPIGTSKAMDYGNGQRQLGCKNDEVPVPSTLGPSNSPVTQILAGNLNNGVEGQGSLWGDGSLPIPQVDAGIGSTLPEPERRDPSNDVMVLNTHDILKPAKEQEGIPPRISEGPAIRETSNDHVDTGRRSHRRGAQKSWVSDSLQIEPPSTSNDPEVQGAYDSIAWCTVHLKVRTDFQGNERLFVVGGNPELGSWDLSLALPLLESEKEEGIRENTVKIPIGTMLEYKYFAEAPDADSALVERWFGPEIRYFLPWKTGEGSGHEIVRDTWVVDIPVKLPLLSWGSRWWEELGTVEGEKNGAYTRREADQRAQKLDSGSAFELEDVSLDLDEWKEKSATEEPGQELDKSLKRKVRKKVFPREEPWLMESVILDPKNAVVQRPKEVEATEGVKGGEEVSYPEPEPVVQVDVLINSPQCTMQRMAILEDSKLVEVRLEPVNTKVLVGNVYLGVVKQLLPGMTGLFVDIGGFQLSLLDMTRNDFPYIFPGTGQSANVAGDDDKHYSSWEGADVEQDEDLDQENGNYTDEDDEEEERESEELDEEEAEARSSEDRAENLQSDDGRDAKSTDDDATIARTDSNVTVPLTESFGSNAKKWRGLQEGMQIIVQVKKEALGKKGPRLTAFPSLAGRFWVLIPGGNAVGVSRKITGPERKRLRQVAQDLLPPTFSLTVRTEAVGHDTEELEKDLGRLMETWREVLERAEAATAAAKHGMEGAVPVLLHRAMGQTLTFVRDFFTQRVRKMVIDSPQCHQEVTSYLQEIAPQLSDRVELYTGKVPIFDAYGVESDIEKLSSTRVGLPNGGSLIVEETEALVSIDVNGGTGVLHSDVSSQQEVILEVNLAAARQIAVELRQRNIGGIIVVDFIDMEDPRHEKLVLDEMRRATSRDPSLLSLSEISEFGLMEMTRKRVRPSVTLTMSEPCSHCCGAGRVPAPETTLSKIEREVLRLLAKRPAAERTTDSAKWPQLLLRVDAAMGEYLKGRQRKRLTQLSAALKVWVNLKVVLEFGAGQFRIVEQSRPGAGDRRPNGVAGPGKSWSSNQRSLGGGLLGKKAVWTDKGRRYLPRRV